MRNTITRTTVGIAVFSCAAAAQTSQPAGPGSYLPAVRAFADNVLRYGRDTYGPKHTPLLADGVNIDTHEPAIWTLPDEQAKAWNFPRTWILSNLASQQNLFRVFVSLTELTGDPKYRQAAVDAIRYAIDHCRHESGLLYWGGHAAIDLATDQPVGEGRSNGVAGKHEFKHHYPFYELMWEIDPAATRKFIEALWSNHILDWAILDFNRHGSYDPLIPDLWDRTYVGCPTPFVGRGLTFSNAGSDLFYAAAMLHAFTGDERPLAWSKRLAHKYVEARHPKTGLGADNFSEEKTRRIMHQFEPVFGERFTEATVTSLYGARYKEYAVCQFKLYERLGPAGVEFKQWAIEDLTAYAKHAYDATANAFRPTLIDGTFLKPEDRQRDGYVEVRWLQNRPAEGIHFWAYALAFKHGGGPLMWNMTRRIGQGLGLGDIGGTPGDPPRLDTATRASDPNLIFGLLDLHAARPEPAYLDLARRVADNLMERRFHKGFFVESPDHLFSRFDTPAPLALLYLEAASRRPAVRLPMYAGGHSFFHCPHEGEGRTYDHRSIFARLRSAGN